MTQKLLNISVLCTSVVLVALAAYIWLPPGLFFADAALQQRSQNLEDRLASLQVADIAELAARPVFQKTRRFKPVEEEVVAVQKPRIPEVPLVKGIAIAEQGNRFVFIQSSKDGLVYQLRKGEYLDGDMQVFEINLNEVLLIDKDGITIILDVNA